MEIKVKGNTLTASFLCIVAAVVCCVTAQSFMAMWKTEALVPAPGFQFHRLSEWEPTLLNSPGDTPVFIQEGKEAGGTLFVMGGTHANEPAGYMAAVVYLERAHVEKGRVIVMPFSNMSARTHNSPQDAAPQYIHFKLDNGTTRVFKFGSRSTNSIHQWPNPSIYIHYPSGQELDGTSRSNQNRAFPGTLDEGLTQRVAYAVTELLKKEKVDVAFDLHEAAPEYPVVNAMVAHERSMELAAEAAMDLEMQGIPMRLEPSPPNLHGLSHREWGDSIPTLMPFLMESGNPSQGRLRGRTDERLVLTGEDKAFVKAAKLGRLFIPYEGRQSISLRTARHLAGIQAVITALNETMSEKGIEVKGVPVYEEILAHDLGHWLNTLPE
ncbi:MAG: succinylglutamate desuccinylase/aspartoacylase family protein [Pyramidobacter sp.]|uniref:succinylglutamate desuccinylase/aspartoacylase domain-containing protein n=1 Tax=Pyramidobacter sp. TaxID=1943581 RepID=UPI002A80484B|nr:succinylglutamate desuccinylase/aspartoacylase family protein [Pyramidobacter sp.]MDY4032815.1 succinylglutamate desuccinylase/aspartoacylase family protein [Pyramidobacter sp.]